MPQLVKKNKNNWANGFLFSALIHWLIIAVLFWLWLNYQKDETVSQLRYCLIVDKDPVIQKILKPVLTERIRTIVKYRDKIIKQPIAPPPINQPEEFELPEKQENQGSLEEERSRIARAYLERLALQIRANRNYPPLAVRRKQEGTALVGLTIKEKGDLENIRIIETSKYPILDKEAIATLNRVNPYDPIPQEILELVGKDGWNIKVPINFKLNKVQEK